MLILNKLHSAMKKDSRLLVMERILHTGTHSEERVSNIIAGILLDSQVSLKQRSRFFRSKSLVHKSDGF